MRYGSLFSGVGGFDRDLDLAGHTCAFQVELDPFCTRVLAERWSGVPRAADVRCAPPVRHIDTSSTPSSSEWSAEWRDIDLLVGGFPCQDLSVAGKRAGLVGERSGLFWEIVRIAQALRPTWGLFENVPGLLSSHGGRDMAAVLEGLRQCWPVVGYRVLDSQHFGVAQRRRRVFFVCGPTEAGVAEVLALTEGGGGHLAAGGEAGAGVAGPLGGGAYGADRRDEDDPNLVFAPLSAGSHDASHMPGRRREDDVNLVLANPLMNSKGGSTGVNRDTTMVVDTTQITSAKNYSNPKAGDPCHPLAEGAHPPLLVSGLLAKTNGGWRMGADEAAGGMLTVRTSGHVGSNGLGVYEHGDSPTLDGSANVGVQSGSLVRRLTPVECEKLQAFPPGWTCLCTPLAAYVTDEDAAALACMCPDSPRYRALGNAVTTSVVFWLGERLRQWECREKNT